MKYAIHLLRSNANNYKQSRHLQELSKEFNKCADYLQNEGEFEGFTLDCMVAELSELKARIVSGLNGWGKNYPEQKKRQENRLKEVEQAINKLKNS